MKNFNSIYNNILSKTNNIIHEGNGGNQPQLQQTSQNQQTTQSQTSQPQPPSQQSVNQLSDDQMEQMEQELKNMLLSSSEYKDLLIGIEAYIKKGESSL